MAEDEVEDAFGGYDLAEFTDEDFAAIDAAIARILPAGPAIHVAIERSPFRQFLSWKKHLAVTDLVSPLWCELQYEYSLYGQRYRPLHLRPTAFTSKSGNQIRVHQQVARANDRRLRRGKSVHKALEDELRPDKLVVHVVSEEERFGLRLLQLIDGFNQLVSEGITRELPVFTITHSQVVLGVIDEVLWSPVGPQETRHRAVLPKSPLSAPSGSPPRKKQRLQEVTSLTLGPQIPTPAMGGDSVAESTKKETTDTAPTCVAGDHFELRIVDYKTRRSPSIPLDQDSLSPRLQLMMYHRMLSSLLAPEVFDFDLLWSRLGLNPTAPFSTRFLKDIVWGQRQVDPTNRNVHLNRLVSEWISAVQQARPCLGGVSRQLRIVYRRSVFVGRRREGGRHGTAERVDVDGPLAALALQEEMDLARATEESLSRTGREDASQVARHVAHNVQQAGVSSVGRTSAACQELISPLGAGQTDGALAWAVQQSLPSRAHEARARVSTSKVLEDDDARIDDTRSAANGATVDASPIIGTREFGMNDDELDAHVANVLQWWLGARPARGVEVGQTNRCFTCEYRDSCEWRADRARTAMQRT